MKLLSSNMGHEFRSHQFYGQVDPSKLTLADGVGAKRLLVEERHALIAACSGRVVQTLTLVHSHVARAGDCVSVAKTSHGRLHSVDGHKRLQGKKVNKFVYQCEIHNGIDLIGQYQKHIRMHGRFDTIFLWH